MPGESGVTVVTMLVCFIYFAREAAGALSARHSPRPLFSWAKGFMHGSGASRREIADAYLKLFGCLKIESVTCARNANHRIGLFIVIARSDEAIQFSARFVNGLLCFAPMTVSAVGRAKRSVPTSSFKQKKVGHGAI